MMRANITVCTHQIGRLWQQRHEGTQLERRYGVCKEGRKAGTAGWGTGRGENRGSGTVSCEDGVCEDGALSGRPKSPPLEHVVEVERVDTCGCSRTCGGQSLRLEPAVSN
jgi:hypothetical protein